MVVRLNYAILLHNIGHLELSRLEYAQLSNRPLSDQDSSDWAVFDVVLTSLKTALETNDTSKNFRTQDKAQ
jgi:hypothetical protein